MKIMTVCQYPPIPIRSLDYCAFDDNTYDGEGCALGHGQTPEAAVVDLAEQSFEDFSDEELDRELAAAVERGDTVTHDFIKIVRHIREEGELPVCGGDPHCLTHRGGSQNMTTKKECRR